MDRKKMQQQARVLRQKKFIRTANPKPVIQNKTVKLTTRMTTPPKDPAIAPAANAQMRRIRAEAALRQRRELLARQMNAQSQPVQPQTPKTTKRRPGCGGCGRKKVL